MDGPFGGFAAFAATDYHRKFAAQMRRYEVDDFE
jgi:hypothetical protein